MEFDEIERVIQRRIEMAVRAGCNDEAQEFSVALDQYRHFFKVPRVDFLPVLTPEDEELLRV